MKRRALLRLAALATGASAIEAARGSAMLLPAPAAPAVRRVLVVFKCHLDVGFTQTQAQVMRKYFDVYYPAAMERAAAMRAAGEDRYVWTTGSWLLYEYLEQANATQRKAMEAAIAEGDIAWHALPFSWQTEMLDASMIAGGLGLAKSLDERFGRTTTGAKMTDVPGHTRGIIAPLHDAGVRLLDIGINAASTPPDVPETFVWKDAAGKSLLMLYHRHDYGSVVPIPGSDLAIDVEVRNDNSGPHTADEIRAIYAKLRQQFPGASVQAASLSEVAAAVEPIRDRLPVVTEEIGDTWIYGIPSDPPKVARYREMARLRREWIANGRFKTGDATDRQMLRRLMLAVEHTWGTDTKSYLDNNHYRPRDLATVLGEPGYRTMQTSWAEKRDDIDESVASLPETLKTEAQTRLRTMLDPVPLSEAGMTPLAPGKLLETTHYTIGFDAATGAITHLAHRKTERNWASPTQPLALFTYQALSSAEYADFLDRYIKSKADWAPRDFGKPNIDAFGAKSGEWHPKLIASTHAHSAAGDRVMLRMRIEDSAAEATGNVAWPRELVMELTLPAAEPVLKISLRTGGKSINRMPEAMWLSFSPVVGEARGWSMDKAGQRVQVEDVVRGGGRAMHAVSETIRYEDARGGRFELATLDAPVVALGRRSPLNFSLTPPDLRGGVHVSLFNNAWGTNYPQWAGGDWMYRFQIRG